MIKGAAWSPGHITAFFEPLISGDTAKSGSRGVGICIDKGVTSEIKISKAPRYKTTIMIKNKTVRLGFIDDVLSPIFSGQNVQIDVKLRPELPFSSGFGMSAASALSTLIAAMHASGFDTDFKTAVSIAHNSEVKNRTGLGDVMGIVAGGISHRTRPGVPPVGSMEHIRTRRKEMILCLAKGEISTRSILTNHNKTALISSQGKKSIRKFKNRPTQANVIPVAREFSAHCSLESKKVSSMLEEAGDAAMVMLGNAVFSFDHSGKTTGKLERHGRIIETNVFSRGVMML